MLNINFTNRIWIITLTLIALTLSFLVLKTNIFSTGINRAASPIVSAVVLPHDSSAAVERETALRQVAVLASVKTIILVSANSKNLGDQNIILTNRLWSLANAVFQPDLIKINQLKLPLADTIVANEPGITNILESIKASFPDAKIIPIAVKQDTPAADLDALSNNLKNSCQNNCLLVSSLDFSVAQSASVASIHNLFSLKALSNLDQKLVWQSDVDSNPVLYLTQKWAASYATNHFRLAQNSNFLTGWYEQGKAQILTTQSFVAGFNLNNFAKSDPRLTLGVDQEIDLNDNHQMGLTCYNQPDYCALNRIFWGPNFYRDILNGLVIEGEIQPNIYKLILVPTDPVTHQLLSDDAKLAVINRIRQKLGLAEIQVTDNYDVLEIAR